jgi:phosphocarrier protein HPr
MAKGFAARIVLAQGAEGPWIDAKSIVKVMASQAPKGSTPYLRVEGDDAGDAIAAIVGLVKRDFDEGHDAG